MFSSSLEISHVVRMMHESVMILCVCVCVYVCVYVSVLQKHFASNHNVPSSICILIVHLNADLARAHPLKLVILCAKN